MEKSQDGGAQGASARNGNIAGPGLDKFGKDAAPLREKTLFLLDMDGTIYNEDRIFDGTLDFLARVEERGGKYLFLTNNSSKSALDYVKKVTGMGIRADLSNFYTSSQATAYYIQKNYPGSLVYCMGTRSLVKELTDAGIRVITHADPAADIVLIGFDTENTSEKIRETCIMLGYRNVYLATNPDLVCPVSFGYIPDCGSMSIMLENATGRKPFFIGKPEPIMIQCVLEQSGCAPRDAAIVGDRLYTDIAAGKNAGVDAVCVLTGEATLADIETSSVKPDYLFDSIRDLERLLRGSTQQ